MEQRTVMKKCIEDSKGIDLINHVICMKEEIKELKEIQEVKEYEC